MTSIPICAVTGLIAGDADACGDCDPCGAAHVVPDVVKRLLAQKEEWREKYGDAVATADAALAALKPFAEYADPRNKFPDTLQITNGSSLARRQLTMGDCYWARDVLSTSQRFSGEGET